jgi:hypothetical protein
MSATRGIAWWAAAGAVSLGVMSYLHLRGLLGSTGRPPFDPSAAGVAEALIVVALLAPGPARPVLPTLVVLLLAAVRARRGTPVASAR